MIFFFSEFIGVQIDLNELRLYLNQSFQGKSILQNRYFFAFMNSSVVLIMLLEKTVVVPFLLRKLQMQRNKNVM